MVEPMWIWGGVGLALLALEMATGTFYVVWFGVAALIVAVTLWLSPNLPQAMQFAMFAGLSLGTLAIWRLNYKKTETHSRVGQAQGEEIGRIGTVVEACNVNQNGKIRFTQGLMGSREWAAVAKEVIPAGANARVIAVEGNALRIEMLE